MTAQHPRRPESGPECSPGWWTADRVVLGLVAITAVLVVRVSRPRPRGRLTFSPGGEIFDRASSLSARSRFDGANCSSSSMDEGADRSPRVCRVEAQLRGAAPSAELSPEVLDLLRRRARAHGRRFLHARRRGRRRAAAPAASRRPRADGRRREDPLSRVLDEGQLDRVVPRALSVQTTSEPHSAVGGERIGSLRGRTIAWRRCASPIRR